MKKTTKNKINKYSKIVYSNILICLIFGGFVSAIICTFNFALSWHNIDLAYNASLVVNDLNNAGIQTIDYRDWKDQYDINESAIMTLTEGYIIGSQGVWKFFFFTMFSVIIFFTAFGEYHFHFKR